MKIRNYALGLAALALLTACSGQTTTASSEGASAATTEAASAVPVPADGASPVAVGTDSAKGSTGAYTLDDVAKHNTKEDCWSVVDGVVYDLTQFVSSHPGGADKIVGMCGRDATDDFNGQHGSDDDAKKKLESFEIGVLSS